MNGDPSPAGFLKDKPYPGRVAGVEGRVVKRFEAVKTDMKSTIFHLLAGLGLIGAVIWVYGGSLQAGFVGDDYYFLEASDSLSKVGRSFTGDWFWHDTDITQARYYRPLQILMTYIESQWLWGETAWGFHLDLLLIHIAVSLLVVPFFYLLAGSVSQTCHPYAAWAAAYLFALHPRHAEPVCMINGRTDSLCGLFFLAALVAYFLWRRGGPRAWRWISWGAFACALLSKEMAVTLPAVLWLHEGVAWVRGRRAGQGQPLATHLGAAAGHWLVLLVLFGVVRTWALGGYLIGKTSYIQHFISLEIYLLSSLKLLAALVLPFEGFLEWFGSFMPAYAYIYGVPLWIFTALGFVYCVARGKILGVWILTLWVICALPILTEISDFQTTLSDRYLYIPSLGAVLGAGWLIGESQAYRAGRWVAGLLMTGWLGASAGQIQIYTAQWRLVGEAAASLVQQINALDAVRPAGEPFCFLSLPSLYEGKPILNTGFEKYWNAQLAQQGKIPRFRTPFLFLELKRPPAQVRTATQWAGPRVSHRVEGGYFRMPYRTDSRALELLNPPGDFPVEWCEFLTHPLPFPMLLLAVDQGRVVPVSRPVGVLYAAQGAGGEGWIEPFPAGPQRAEPFPAVPLPMIQSAQLDPGRGIHLSRGDINGDRQEDLVISFGPTEKEIPFPGIIYILDGLTRSILGHPFSPFPREHPGAAANPYGEVYTAVGRFIPGREQTQIACAQGAGGKQIVRLYEYTGQEAPKGFQLLGQFDAFEIPYRPLNPEGGITLSAGDLDGDGYDELITGQTQHIFRSPLIQVITFGPAVGEEAFTLRAISPAYPVFGEEPRIWSEGVHHAVGDVNGDGIPEIVVSPLVGIQRIGNIEGPPAWFRILRAHVEEGRIIGFSRLDDVEWMPSDSQTACIQTVACGNLDLDPADEVVVGVLWQGKAEGMDARSLEYLPLFADRALGVAAIDLQWREDNRVEFCDSAFSTPPALRSPRWLGLKDQWLSVTILTNQGY